MIPRKAICVAAIVMATGAAGRAAEPYDPVAAGELPQYIFFNRNPGSPDQLRWRQGEPSRFTVASMREIPEKLGTAGNDRLRVGPSFIFSLLESDTPTLKRSIQAMVEAAEEANVPILITLDGQNWWESRPDLWNWWDPSLPGFDPANRENVEWTGWGPEHAIKISWRNWGTQIRIRPAQNIFAPRVQAEIREKLAACVPVIAHWYRELPRDKKWLFGGVKLGWETSINVNAYYHENGNRIFEAAPGAPSKDPTLHDAAYGFTFGNVGLGYAAATSLQLRKTGELTIRDHEVMVHRYLADLCRHVRQQGIPAHLIFTHQGGTYAPWDKHLSFRPAINDDSIPGWSFYSHDPPDCGSLAADMESAGRKQWAAAEWWRGGSTTAEWRKHFERSLAFKQCRLITVYNWEPFRELPEATAAVREVVARAKQTR